MVSEHRLYRDLGATAAKRQRVYRDLFRAPFAKGFPDDLLAAVNGGWALGSPAFQAPHRSRLRPPRRPAAPRPPPQGQAGRQAAQTPLSRTT